MNNSPRRGFSLIEMQAFIAISSVLMLLTLVWGTQVMRFSARMKSQRQHHSQLTRLSRNLRADVQMSQSLSVKDETRLVLKHGTQTITYEILDSSIRVEKTGNPQLRREEYLLAPNSRAQWETKSLPDSIGLIVTRLANKPEPRHESFDELTLGSLPIDIHIFASKDRWPVVYPVDQSAISSAAREEKTTARGKETAEKEDEPVANGESR